MDERRTIEEKLHKKEQEVRVLEERLKTARIYIQALQDILKSIDKNSIDSLNSLKSGSAVTQARDIILSMGNPVHINLLLEKMGKDTGRESRASLTSSISAYVRKREIFTRTAPNTFGLIELGHESMDEGSQEPPSDFGEPGSSRAPPPPRRAPSASAPAETEDDDIPF